MTRIPEGCGPCVKQTVTATVIATDGARFTATNYCRNPQTACPRADLPSGVGYDLCLTVCDQVGHAEVNALRDAGEQARGAVLYLEGHTYACDNCKATASSYGVARIEVGAPPA